MMEIGLLEWALVNFAEHEPNPNQCSKSLSIPAKLPVI